MNPIANFNVLKASKTLGRYVLPSRCFNSKLTPEIEVLRKTCKDFASKELTPIAGQLDKNGTFPAEQIKKLGALGLMSINVHPSQGGAGGSFLDMSVVVEELAIGCASTAAVVSIHNCLYAALIDRKGTPQQKEQFLAPYLTGEIGCFALSEPNAGSDVAGLQTSARKDGDYWILNGTKAWVSSAKEAKAIIVFANVDKTRKHRGITAFLMNLDTPGITVGPKDDLMGIRALSSCSVYLEDVRVPHENILGQVGEGFRIAMMQLDRARIGIASQALGIGQAALNCAIQYSLQRIAFNRPLAQISAVQHRIADMAIRQEAARLLTWKAAQEMDSSPRATKAASMAKVAASTAANFIADNCVQILGGMGFTKGLSAERHYRDARVTQIYGGVTDVQKMVIAQQLIKESL